MSDTYTDLERKFFQKPLSRIVENAENASKQQAMIAAQQAEIASLSNQLLTALSIAL